MGPALYYSTEERPGPARRRCDTSPELGRRSSSLALVLALPARRERRPAPVMGWAGADWLERPGRDEEQKPDEIIRTMGLKAGDVVADLGAGTGYFTRRLARAVAPTGLVYAVDIQPEMISLLKGNMEKAGIRNVVPVLSARATTRSWRRSLSTGSCSSTSTTSSSSPRRRSRGCARP